MRKRRKHRNPKPGIAQRLQTLMIWIKSDKKIIRNKKIKK